MGPFEKNTFFPPDPLAMTKRSIMGISPVFVEAFPLFDHSLYGTIAGLKLLGSKIIKHFRKIEVGIIVGTVFSKIIFVWYIRT